MSTIAPAPTPSAPDTGPGSAPRQGSRDLYRVIWRWHFFAGLAIAPVMFVAALTGALLVFADDLRPVMYPERYVAQAGEARSLDERAAAAGAAASGDIESVFISASPEGTTRFTINGAERTIVSVSPSAKVQATFAPRSDFFDTVEQLHRSLLAGTTGRVVVELCTAWGVVLVLTGVYLWWPRGRSWREGVLGVRWRSGGYLVWRDLHAVTGACLSLVFVAILVTGFLFSFVEGQLLRNYVLGGPNRPAGGGKPAPVAEGAWQRVADAARANGLADHDFVIRPPRDGGSLFSAGTAPHQPAGVIPVSMQIDGLTGAVAKLDDGRSARPGQVIRRWGYSIHVGSVFGRPSQVIALLATLALAGLSVTGVSMWWIRRPAGRTGIPPRVEGVRIGWVVLIVAIAVGVLMPVVGASLLVVLALDWIWRRVTPKRQ